MHLLLIAIILILVLRQENKITRKMKANETEKKAQQQNTEWKSEWTWNEETQLWEHPLSKKTDTSYHYRKSDLPNEEPIQQKQYHHTDTSFKVRQEPSFSEPKVYHQPQKPTETTKKSEYQNAYEATPILTQNEFRNYQTLNQAAMQKGYMVNCKVRLADIVKPRNDPQYMSRFGKIKSKHVDFVILDNRMKVRAIIELDDKTHDRADRQKRDEFVDSILQECGYKVIHTRYITPDILDTV